MKTKKITCALVVALCLQKTVQAESSWWDYVPSAETIQKGATETAGALIYIPYYLGNLFAKNTLDPNTENHKDATRYLKKLEDNNKELLEQKAQLCRTAKNYFGCSDPENFARHEKKLIDLENQSKQLEVKEELLQKESNEILETITQILGSTETIVTIKNILSYGALPAGITGALVGHFIYKNLVARVFKPVNRTTILQKIWALKSQIKIVENDQAKKARLQKKMAQLSAQLTSKGSKKRKLAQAVAHLTTIAATGILSWYLYQNFVVDYYCIQPNLSPQDKLLLTEKKERGTIIQKKLQEIIQKKKLTKKDRDYIQGFLKNEDFKESIIQPLKRITENLVKNNEDKKRIEKQLKLLKINQALPPSNIVLEQFFNGVFRN